MDIDDVFKDTITITNNKKGFIINENAATLKLPSRRHAMVLAKPNLIFLVGGWIIEESGSEIRFSKRTMIFNMANGKISDGHWSNGPDLNIGRCYHATNTIKDHDTDEEYIVTSGGKKSYDIWLDSVEILFGINEKKWIAGIIIQ